MKIFVCILAVAGIVWYSYSLWHGGYTTGVMEERRKRMRSIVAYNTHITTFRTELSLLQEELDNIKKNVPCARPERFEEQVISARMLNDEFEPKTTIEEVEKEE